jgi:hypothetical protein
LLPRFIGPVLMRSPDFVKLEISFQPYKPAPSIGIAFRVRVSVFYATPSRSLKTEIPPKKLHVALRKPYLMVEMPRFSLEAFERKFVICTDEGLNRLMAHSSCFY